MDAALDFAVILVAFYGFAFGAARLRLRRTFWEQFSLALWLPCWR
jgi:hypothetical protein